MCVGGGVWLYVCVGLCVRVWVVTGRWRDGAVMAGGHAEAAADQLFELAVTFRSLARKTDEPVHFYVELLKDQQSVERIPHEGAIETTVPSPDYELIMWQV